MGKTIAFNENSLMVIKKKLNEIMVGTDSVSHNDVSVNEAAPEADEYEIGAEPNSPVGGVYYHIKQEEKNLDESKISGNEREEDRRIISLAVEEFGVTDDVIKAGYILPDGSFLDFDEGEGYRTIDHRNIEGIFKENGIEHEYRSEYVSDFLNCGAIRCCCMTGLLNMQREPTSEQYSSIENFVRFVPSSTYINVGFDNSQGDEEHYACYLNPNPKMVISDIYKYYNEGIKPQGNACYESKKNKSAIISEKQLKTIKENLESGVIAENSTDRRVNAIISKYANVNDFQEIRNIRSKILKLIPNARAKNDKYLGAVAMYYLTGCLNDREDAFKLNYLLGKVAKYPSPSGIYGKTDFGMVPFEVIKQEMEWLPSENVVNSYKNTEKIKRVGNYTIMRMDSYDDTAFVDNNLEVDVPWCIFNDEETYFNMTDGYTVYVCIRDGYENIDMMKYEEVIQKLSENNLEDVKESILEYYPEEEQWPDFVWDMADSGEYAADSFFGLDSYKFGLPPCDDYGLSMFVVLVSNFDCAKGEIGGVYSRYNLPNLCDGDIMTDKELSELLGADCNSVFPPHITSENVNENIEKEVESSEVDLSSFKKKESLQPKIWKDEETLDSRIRLKLLDIADDFWEFVNLTWVEPKGIIITGSICNFNWSEFSDIDLHLIVDFEEVDEKVEFVKQYFDMKKNEWNKEHGELTIMGFPVELYVQDVADEVSAGGIYDIEENKWIRKPDFDDVKSIGLNKFSIKDKAAEIMTIIDDMWDAINDETDSHRIEEIGEDADYLWKKIKEMRKNSLEENGENGSGNIVYKCLRRFGYLEKIWKLRTLCYDKVNSITESKEVINEYLEKNYNLPLYKYFKWAEKATSCEKAEDLAYSCSYYITEYISDLEDFVNYEDFEALLNEEGEFDYEDDEAVENFLSLLEKNRLCDHFVANIVDKFAWMV